MSGEGLAAVAIGASAGALEALSAVLPGLPPGFPPVLVVVHLPPDKPSLMAELLRTRCRMKVKEAEDKEPAEAGTIYLAPPNYHLLVERRGTLALSSDEPVLYSRPSIDVMLEAASDAYRDRLAGVVLTGANSDGAKGLAAVLRRGGKALVQSPEGAYARTMPLAAMKLCPEAEVLPLDAIAARLGAWV